MSQITAVLQSGTLATLSNGRHTWTADEPLAAGGTDTGPNPYELLLSSLAACICLTISMYCNHKKLSLQSVRASLDFARIHADDCKGCEMPDRGFIEQIPATSTSQEILTMHRKSGLRRSHNGVRCTRRWLKASHSRTMRRSIND